MSSLISDKKRFLLELGIIVVLTVVIWGVFYMIIFHPEAVDFTALRRTESCDPVRMPELRPSMGLAWSRRTYPDQYAGAARESAAFTGLDDRWNERFLDIAGRAYTRELVAGFSYTDARARRPNVVIEYLPRAETFTGRIVARGLKPNFAYQIKLRGIFDDRLAFERIGFLGRWRMPGLATNYKDADYAAYPDKQHVESYILFDYFVTDMNGEAEKEFYLDSTLHVLWNATTQRKPAAKDSRPVSFLASQRAGQIFSNPVPDLRPQRLYAESEADSQRAGARPDIGRAFLPAGTYRAEVVLTEESFHGWGDSGFWPTVMRAPVRFEIVDRPRPTPEWKTLEPIGEPVALTWRDAVDAGLPTAQPACLESPPLSAVARLAPGERCVLRFEARTGRSETLDIQAAADGEAFDENSPWTVRAAGCTQWRRFEIEMTSEMTGTPRIRIVPRSSEPRSVSIRDVVLCRVVPEAR